ncbi:hypothetical protein [Tolypothrix sp. VBCCA 56010]|uniref:hypothetical protein n=1 Tax=Tolypothrix sp. VBCCA 56010 TaxID=3137731 RepID=UPI003D7F04B9
MVEVVPERSPSFLLKLSQCRFERPRAIATNRSEVRWAFAPPEAIAKFQADTVSGMPAAFHSPAKTLRDPLMVSPKLKRLLRQNWLECKAIASAVAPWDFWKQPERAISKSRCYTAQLAFKEKRR